MQSQIEYSGPSLYAYNFDDPHHVKRALGAIIDSVAEAMGEVSDKINNSYYITTAGKSLEELVNQSRWRPGEVRWFHCTWSQSLKIASEAQAVHCDGRNGTPQLINNPNDSNSVSRFLKAATFGVDSSTTGGAATHVHTFSDPTITVDPHAAGDLSHDHAAGSLAITANGTHTHDFCVESCPTDGLVTVAAGTDVQVASCCHTHQVNGTTETPSTALTISGNTDNGLTGAVTHSASASGGAVGIGSAEPPYATLIPLMKL